KFQIPMFDGVSRHITVSGLSFQKLLKCPICFFLNGWLGGSRWGSLPCMGRGRWLLLTVPLHSDGWEGAYMPGDFGFGHFLVILEPSSPFPPSFFHLPCPFLVDLGGFRGSLLELGFPKLEGSCMQWKKELRRILDWNPRIEAWRRRHL